VVRPWSQRAHVRVGPGRRPRLFRGRRAGASGRRPVVSPVATGLLAGWGAETLTAWYGLAPFFARPPYTPRSRA